MNYVKLVFVSYYLSAFLFSNLVTIYTPKYTQFAYQRLYQIADPWTGMEYFAKKLGVNGFLYDHLMVRHTKPFVDWLKEFEVFKESVRNIDTCSLKKTANVSRAHDAVGILGTKECFKQCQMENKEFYKYLNGKLQKLIRRKPFKAEVRLTHYPFKNESEVPEGYYSCVKQKYKRYVCECTYSRHLLEASEKFKKTFKAFIEDLYGLSPADGKMLEERYQLPLKLVAFLISCHLLPSAEVFSFLVWWDTVENPSSYTTTTSSSSRSLITSDEECGSTFEEATKKYDKKISEVESDEEKKEEEEEEE